MKVIPGSHKQIVAHKEGVANNLLLRGQEVAVTVDERKAVFMELEAGEMSIHHSLMFHGSEENRAERAPPRLRDPLHPDARRADRRTCPATARCWSRGTDRYNHFDAESSPTRALAPEAVALHRKSTATYAEINRLAVAKHDEIVAATRQ